jgi:glycosyltransferase involved in cell wall biosynthesis
MANHAQVGEAVTLVLPCYNEADIFEESLSIIDAFFHNFRYDGQYIFVEDASTDETPHLIDAYVADHDDAKAIYHDQNRGRGRTVADGIRAADTDIVGYIDIDLEVSIYEIYPIIRELEAGADVVCGYRQYKLNINRLSRTILSWGYKYLTQVLIGSPFSDTEAGCKFFDRKRILPVLNETVSEDWFWDTEVMIRAHRAGLDVHEHPVLFVENPKSTSTVRVLPDTARYLWNLWHFSRGRESRIV